MTAAAVTYKDPSDAIRILPYSLDPASGHGRYGANIRFVTWHRQQGNDDLYYDFLGRTEAAGNLADSTFWAKKDGKLNRLLRDSDAPWTNGFWPPNPNKTNPVIKELWDQTGGKGGTNAWTITIETEGYVTEPLTDGQIDACAKVVAYCYFNLGIPADRTHHVGHYEVGEHANCPGPLFPFDEILRRGNILIAAAQNGQVAAVPAPAPVIFVPETGKSVGFGFKDFWLGLDKLGDNYRLLILGLPVTNEFDIFFSNDPAKKRTVQLFERNGLLYEAENAAPWDNHPMTTGQLLEAYHYAIANGLIFADSRTAGVKAQDNLALNQAAFAEAIQASLESWAKAGITLDQLKQLDAMLAAWRAGKSYEDYKAGLGTGK